LLSMIGINTNELSLPGKISTLIVLESKSIPFPMNNI